MSDIPSLFPLGSRAGSYLRRVPPASSIRIILIRSDLGIIDTLQEILVADSPVRIYDMVTELSLHFQVSFHFLSHFPLSIPLFPSCPIPASSSNQFILILFCCFFGESFLSIGLKPQTELFLRLQGNL